MPAMSVNKNIAAIRSLRYSCWMVKALRGTQDGGKWAAYCQAHLAGHGSHPDGVPEEAGDEKAQGAGPRWLKCITKGDFSEPGLLHLPYIEKC